MNPSLEQREVDAETPGDRAVRALMKTLGPSLEGRPILLAQIKKEVDEAVERAIRECFKEGGHAHGTQHATGETEPPALPRGDC